MKLAKVELSPNATIAKFIRMLRSLPIAVTFILIGAKEGRAFFPILDLKPVPIERLLANVQALVEKHPTDANGYYVLGRLHSMEWAGGSGTWEADTRGSLPYFGIGESVFVRPDERRQGTDEEVRTHLLESIRNYRRATEILPHEAHYFLGLAWMLEQGSRLVSPGLVTLPPWYDLNQLATKTRPDSPIGRAVAQIGRSSDAQWNFIRAEMSKDPEKVLPELIRVDKEADSVAERNIRRLLAEFWVDSALSNYRIALSECETRSCGFLYAIPPAGYEAGQAVIRILQSRASSGWDVKDEISRVNKILAEIKSRPRAITPVIFPLDGTASVEQLIDSRRYLEFDLDGSGDRSRWTWVTPQAGFLAWDPFSTGRIESGIQLFGSVTWWIFWENGYQALAALDDDGDGWLQGPELKGIVVWSDRNQDGVSQPIEVQALDEIGISAIAVSGATKCGGLSCSSAGIRFSDGRIAPTYDWIASPYPE